MLYFLSFIWFYLLLAAIAGGLLTYGALKRRHEKELAELYNTIEDRDVALASLQAEKTALKKELAHARAEAVSLNLHVNQLSQRLLEAKKPPKRQN